VTGTGLYPGGSSEDGGRLACRLEAPAVTTCGWAPAWGLPTGVAAQLRPVPGRAGPTPDDLEALVRPQATSGRRARQPAGISRPCGAA